MPPSRPGWPSDTRDPRSLAAIPKALLFLGFSDTLSPLPMSRIGLRLFEGKRVSERRRTHTHRWCRPGHRVARGKRRCAAAPRRSRGCSAWGCSHCRARIEGPAQRDHWLQRCSLPDPAAGEQNQQARGRVECVGRLSGARRSWRSGGSCSGLPGCRPPLAGTAKAIFLKKISSWTKCAPHRRYGAHFRSVRRRKSTV